MLERLYESVIAGDVAAVSALFPGPVAIDTPLSGAIDGTLALENYLLKEGAWLRQRKARVELLAKTSDDAQTAVELIVYLAQDGNEFDVPVALIGQKVRGGYGQIRVYHSTWPINGKHAYRAPIVWPKAEMKEPPVVEHYFAELDRGNTDAILAMFTEDGYVREPSGSRYTHAGAVGRSRFYAGVAALPGGVGLTHATASFDGKLFAVEYLCDRWGTIAFPPMAGCAFYELAHGGARIKAVRIYDDVTPPGE